jgi:4-amino-4-deoxy-L-arabinose transferase-like glycosyltransferase
VRAEQHSEARRALGLGLAVFAYALGLRAGLIGLNPFHMDEALYAGFSRRIIQGDLLLSGGLNNDKPPLQFYLGALSSLLFGEREASMRLLNAAASALECGLLSWALLPLAGVSGAALAGVLLASSPLGAGYGASFLMDGPLSLLLLASFIAASRGRAGLAGLLWALACAAKQTAYFLLPWPLLGLLLSPLGRAAWLPFAKGAAAGLLPLWVWSALFQHPRLGMLLLMQANQPEVGLGASTGPGAEAWLDLARRGLVVPGLFNALAVLGLLGLPWLAWRSRSSTALRPWLLAALAAPSLLLLFLALGMRGFDRYWLPALPWVAALPALGLAALQPQGALRRWAARLALVALLATLWQARDLDVDGMQGTGWSGNRGFPEACAELKRQAPQGGTLVGDAGGLHWLGNWYLGRGWRLFESPGEDGLAALQGDLRGKPLYWLSRGPGARRGPQWRALPAPAGWTLQQWEAEP